MATMQRIGMGIDGYDDDPRELWNIPEVREWVIKVFKDCPHIFFLAAPNSNTLELFAACYCREDGSDDKQLYFDPRHVHSFLNEGFQGLNEVTQRYAISVEINKRISDCALAVLNNFFDSRLNE